MKIRSLLMTVATMLLSACNIQHSILYFPSPTLPDAESLARAHLKLWPSPATTNYRGLVASQETPDAKGTTIVFHGNGGTAADRGIYVELLAALGYRVILAEYPRYGGRQGELGEKAFVRDAGETVRLAFEQFGAPIFLLGESLGCGVAAAVAHAAPVRIEGVILVTPWDTLAAIAQSKFPFLPVRLLLTDTYDNLGNLREFPGKIAVVGAGRDEVVPVRHADTLYRGLASPAKRMWLIKEAGHNDVLYFTDQRWWREVMDFVSNNG